MTTEDRRSRRSVPEPVDALVDYLEGSSTLDEFLDDFPSVRREQAIAALEILRDTLLAQ